MKKLLVTAALAATSSAYALDAYVGTERDTKANNTIVYAGGEHTIAGITIAAQADMSMNDGTRGKLSKVNLDASYAVTNNLSVYVNNDLNKDFQRTETTVGAKWKF